MVSGILACLLWVSPSPRPQEAVQQQIDDALRQFQDAAQVDQALTLLSAQLAALGAQATNPLARRLAQDLRDGMASAAAPAFIEALAGRPDALAPLQAAFRDASTSAAGRIELAGALLHLDDALSWRQGLLDIGRDDAAPLGDRLRALGLLLEAEDARGPGLLRGLVEALPRRPEPEQRQAVDFLVVLNTPLARELLGSVASDLRLSPATRASALPARPGREASEEPQETIVEESPRRIPVLPQIIVKKKETRDASFFTMPTMLAGAVAAVLLMLLLVEILRRG